MLLNQELLCPIPRRKEGIIGRNKEGNMREVEKPTKNSKKN